MNARFKKGLKVVDEYKNRLYTLKKVSSYGSYQFRYVVKRGSAAEGTVFLIFKRCRHIVSSKNWFQRGY